eukprot:937263-Prorocentrum_lima.AAC.1
MAGCYDIRMEELQSNTRSTYGSSQPTTTPNHRPPTRNFPLPPSPPPHTPRNGFATTAGRRVGRQAGGQQ